MDPHSTPGSDNPVLQTPPAAPPAMPLPGLTGPPIIAAGGQGGHAEAPAPPVSAAAASWLPPTVPVQADGQQAHNQGWQIPGQAAGGGPGTQSASGGSTGGTLVPVPQVADDGDLIEKEWVQKAKKIVEQTRQDPYKQTRELHKFRAEYMKKRYNKVIEPVDE